MNFQLAQINVARMKGANIDDPIMKEFVDNLDRINALAEQSDGFVWRLKDEDDNATSFDPYNDEQVIINISVWENVNSLKDYVYNSFHSHFLKRRKEWFIKYGKAYTALWWIKAGDFPTVEESVERLESLQQNGPTDFAFNFSSLRDKPN